MYCVNCGKVIQNNSKFCSYCGKCTNLSNQLENIQMAEITIVKNSSVIIGSISVYVDNDLVVPKTSNKYTTIKLPFGQHKIRVSIQKSSDEVNLLINKEYPFIYIYIPEYLDLIPFPEKIKITSVVEKKTRMILE